MNHFLRIFCAVLALASLAIAAWLIVEPIGEFNGVAVVWAGVACIVGIYGGVRG